jgi:hypothetical protein
LITLKVLEKREIINRMKLMLRFMEDGEISIYQLMTQLGLLSCEKFENKPQFPYIFFSSMDC